MNFVKSDSLKLYLSANDQKWISSPEHIKNALSKNRVFAFDIYSDKLLVGFAMIRQFDEGEFFLWDFAIDSNLQNKHYGCQALKELLHMLKEQYHAKLVTTTYTYGNAHAKYIYEKIGFIETDTVDEDGVHEVNMEIKL